MQDDKRTARILTVCSALLFIFFLVSSKEAQSADFKVQRWEGRVQGASLVLTAPTNFTAVSSLNNAFVTITSSQQTGAGDSVGGGSQNFNLWTASVRFDSTSQITITTPSASADTWVAIEIIEYIGTSGGDNEIIVRAQGEVTFGSTNTTADVTGFTLSDINDGVLWLTGWQNPSGNRSSSEGSRVSGSFPNTTTGRWTRNATDAGAIVVSYAVIEFTGANWKIQRVEHNYTAAGAWETENITAVNDLSRAFIHVQKRIDSGDAGLDEHGAQVYISSDSQVSFYLDTSASTPSRHYSVAWVIENTQNDSNAMKVSRYSGTQSGGTEPLDTSTGITAVGDTSQTSLSANCSVGSSATGTAYPRPQMAFYLDSASQVGLWVSDTGKQRDWRLEVIEWPQYVPKIDISGTVYTNEAKSANIGADKTVALSVNGATVTTAETDTSGQFTFTDVIINPDDVLLLYLDDETEDGSLVTVTDGLTDLTGANALEMVTGKIILEYQTGSSITNTNLDVIDAVDVQNEDGITSSGVNVVFADGFEVWVDSGKTYAPGGTVETDSFEIDATAIFNPAANAVTLSGDFTVSATGTFTSSGTVTFDGTTKQILSTGGTDINHDFEDLTHSGSGELELDASSDLAVNNTFSQSGTGDFDTQGKAITAGTLSVSDGTFNTDARAGTWTIGTGGVNITGGTLTATSGTFNVAGDFSNSGTFDANSSTVTFNATSGSPTIDAPGVNGTFYNILFNDTGNNITFSLGSAIEVDNDITIDGGTFDLNGQTVTVRGSWDNNDTLNGNGGRVIFGATSGSPTIDSPSSGGAFYDLEFDDAGNNIIFTLASVIDVDNDLTITGGTLDTNSGSSFDIDVGGSFTNADTLTVNNSLITFDASAGTPSINAPASGGALYDVAIDSAVSISLGTDIVLDNDLTITNGTLNASGQTITIAGNWDNNASFNANNGLVIFDADTTGHTIEAGTSSFYDVEFNNASGGWTIQTDDLTATNDFTLTDISSFTVASGITLQVQGQFSTSVGTTETTWTGSTLYLNGSGSYTVNEKTAPADTYATLRIGASQHVRLWNAFASTFTIDSGGSLYLMDPDSNGDDIPNDGLLIIFGTYSVPEGSTDYWSYATDFDGADLSGGNERTAAVYMASDPAVTCGSGETLEIIGTSSNPTTITRYTGTSYSLTVNDGTINAQYYSFQYLDGTGLNITGSNATVGSLDNGTFDNSGGTGASDAFITVAAASIDNNPTLTISGITFNNTNSAAEYNVTATGTTSSFWDFDASAGTFDGEANDNDPGGDPGYIVWDDSSGASINISGMAYIDDDEASTVPNGTTVSLAVNNSFNSSTTTTAGSFSFNSIGVNIGDILTFYFDGESFKGSTVTTTDGTAINNIRIYEDHVVVGHQTTATLSISQMALYDKDSDADINFDAEDAATDTLIADDGSELFVPTGFTFQPGGNLASGVSGVYDVDIRGSFTCVSSEQIRVSGSWRNQGSFSAANSLVTFDASGGTPIITTGGNSFYDAAVNASATYTLAGDAATNGNLTVTAGTLEASTYTLTSGGVLTVNGGILTATGGNIDANSNIIISSGTLNAPGAGNTFSVAGNWENSGGTFASGTGKVTFNGGALQTVNAGGTGNSNKDFYDVEKSTAGILRLITTGFEADGTLTIPAAVTFEANGQSMSIGTLNNSGILKLLGSEAQISITTMDTAKGEVVYTGDGDGTGEVFTIKDFGSLDYYDVTINDTNTIKDTFRTNADLSVNHDIEVLDGILDISFNGNTLTVAGTLTVDGGTLTAANGNIDANGDVSVASGILTAPGSSQYCKIAGSLAVSGTFTHSSGTVLFDASSGTPTIDSGGQDFYDIEFDDGGNTITFTLNSDITVLNDITITSGTLDTGADRAIAVGNNWADAGGFVSNTGIVTFNKASGTQTIDAGGTGIATKDFYHLTKTGGGVLQLINSGLQATGTVTISTSTTLDLNGQDFTAASVDNQELIQATGAETVAITTMDSAEGTVTYTGDGDTSQETFSIAGFGASTYYNLTINDTNPTKDIFQTTEDLTVNGALTVNGGTLTATNYNIDANGTVDLTSGTINAPGSTKTFAIADDLTVSGTFNHGSGEVVFDTSNGVTLDAPGSGLTFYDFSCSTASKVFNFTASDTFTVEGVFTLNGGSAVTRIDLNSSSPGTAWNLILNGTHSVQYVDVQDSNVSGTASLPVNPTGSYNSGNNTNWFPVDFVDDPNALRSSQDRHTFYDGTDYWTFYIDSNSDVVYRKSTDGIDWPGNATVVASGTYTSLGIWEDGTYVYCVYTDGSSLFEKRITISDETQNTEREVIENFAMEWGTSSSVTSTFTTVNLINDYGSSMVAKASPGYTESDDPTVTRMQNAANTSFDVRVQNAGGTGPATQTVYYLVMKATSAGTQVPGSSTYIEAQTYTSTITDENNSWVGQQQTYQNSYTSPRVVGQVMTQNDTSWSTFWSNGNGGTNPVTNSSIYTGKHVAEDTTVTRSNETVGFIVCEDDTGTINGIKYEVGSGTGFDRIYDTPGTGTTGTFSQTFSAAPATGVIDNTGQGGANGAWALWYGTTPFTSTQFAAGVDEDTIGDTERTGNADQVHYYVFETSGGYYGADVNHVQIIKDSSDYLWIKWENSVNDTFIVRSTNTADESAWDPHYITKSSTDSTDYGHSQIVPLASGSIMCIYQDGNTLYSKIFSDPASQGSATQIITDCATGNQAAWDDTHYFSVVSDISGTDYLVYLTYIDSTSGYVKSVFYDSTSGSWDTAETVSNSGSCSFPSVFYDAAYGTIYALWIDGTAIKYKRREGPSWPVQEETLKSGLDTPSFLNAAYSDADIVPVLWREGSTSPFLSYGTINIAATIVSLSEFYALGFDSAVTLTWKTESEIDNAGFNLYRSSSSGGYTQINSSLIEGLGTSVVGKEYSYQDTDVTAGASYYYILESVETGGAKRKFGPVTAHPGKDTDSDGMSDDYEYYYGLDPSADDASTDPDGDGLTNAQEYAAGSDPFAAADEVLSWEASEPGTPGVTVISSTDTEIVLELVTNEFDAEDKVAGSDTYQLISFPEYAHSFNEDPGKPMVPVKGVLISMKDKTPVGIEVVDYDSESMNGYSLYPVPERTLVTQGATTYLESQFYKDAVTYASDSFYPSSMAQLDYSGILRGQEVVKVRLMPLRFNPATGAIEFARRLRVKITIQAQGAAGASAAAGAGVPSGTTGALKIQVAETGVVRVTRQDLIDAGVEVNGLEPRTIKVYRQGAEIPIYAYGEEDGSLDAGDYIEFYGERETSRYTYTNVYWLTHGGESGLRMGQISADAGVVPASFLFTEHHEVNEFYWSEIEGADDPWYLYPYIKAAANESFTVPLIDVFNSAQDASISLNIQGYNTYDNSEAVTYHARVYLNSYLVADESWTGPDAHTVSVQIPSYWLIDGDNTVKVEHILDDTAYPNSWIFIDWIDISYWRALKAHNDYLLLNAQGPGTFTWTVTGFSSDDIRVYDVTDADNASRVTVSAIESEGASYKVTFNADAKAASQYAVLSSTGAAPSGFVADTASALRDTSNQADYIIITVDGYADAVEALAQHRRDEGFSVVVVKLTDVYDEFSYGVTDAAAIKDFLYYAYTQWQSPAPVYVLLVGDSTYDYRDDEQWGFTDYLPSYMVFNKDFGETATDDWFVCFDGEDDVFPDMLIGRFPAKTAEEAQNMAAKTIAYENVSLDEPWVDDMLFVADDEGTFEAMTGTLSGSLPDGYNSNTLLLSSYASNTQCRSDIIQSINEGKLMVTYSGHGGIDIWADEQILRVDDVASLTNKDKYPFFVTLNCVNGYFIYPEFFECLAEELLRADESGAVAVFAPSGTSLPAQQAILAEGLYDSLFKDKERILGSAVAKAKLYLFQEASESASDVLQTFILFGDPALVLRKEAPAAAQTSEEPAVFVPPPESQLLFSYGLPVDAAQKYSAVLFEETRGIKETPPQEPASAVTGTGEESSLTSFVQTLREAAGTGEEMPEEKEEQEFLYKNKIVPLGPAPGAKTLSQKKTLFPRQPQETTVSEKVPRPQPVVRKEAGVWERIKNAVREFFAFLFARE